MVPGGGAGTIDLGDDPPMILGDDDEAEEAPIHRAVSWRWMTGTVLTGVTSVLLMGAALTVALNNPNQFASLPDSFTGNILGSDGIIFGGKGDRVHPVEQAVASRQVIQVSTTTRQGDRDFIKLKPFAKINATLAVHKEFASAVPPYDATRIFVDNSETDPQVPEASTVIAAADAVPTEEPTDSEVALKVMPFPIADPDLEPTVKLESPEVEQIVRAYAHIDNPGDLNAGSPTLSYADATAGPTLGNSPFSALGVKIVPENVSNIAKSIAGGTLDEGYQEKIISITKAESLRAVFEDNAITGDDADEIIAALSQLIDVSRLRPGQKVRVAFATDPSVAALDQPDADADGSDPGTAGDAKKASQSALEPIRVSIYENGAHQATVARADNNVFVRADEPSATPELLADAPVDDAPAAADGPPKLYDALYETALDQQVPAPLIDQLVHVFAYDVDFTARISPGDSMEIFHSIPDASDSEAGAPEVLFASLTLGGVTKRLYRFRSPDDNVVDYYDEAGKSAKKFLMRKPVSVARISSPFGWRVHPLLGYRRLHAGVDYATTRGTPIFAAGNGIVEKAGPSSGFGNLIELRHLNGYETLYGHQQGFAKGIKPGVRVHQGQIIGYVGSTGLSTGPHVHFEIRVNGQPVDPLRIRLPRGRVLEGDSLKTFEQERARIDDLLGNPASNPQTVASADGPATN
jgi:murein DD-endopeptidase MepM/ murein hydrolase activator NlpD